MKCPYCKSAETDFIRRGLAEVEEVGYFHNHQWEVSSSERLHDIKYYTDEIECCDCHKKFKISEIINGPV